MLPAEFQKNVSDQSTDNEIATSVEKAQIRESLIKNNWVQSKAADDLKIPLSTLRRKIKKYNITKIF